MPDKDLFHDQVQIQQYHHAGHTSNIQSNAYPLHMPSAFVAFHPQMPNASLEQRTQENRYLWDPTVSPSSFSTTHSDRRCRSLYYTNEG